MRWPITLRIAFLIMAVGLAVASLRLATDREIFGPGSVLDGDSIRLLDQDIRLKGVDAPEYRQTCQGPSGEIACGRDARRALAALVARGNLRCRLAGRDRYGRSLGYCRIGDLDVNAEMVRQGHALAFGEFAAEEAAAKAAGRGLWRYKFERPEEWRAKHPRTPQS